MGTREIDLNKDMTETLEGLAVDYDDLKAKIWFYVIAAFCLGAITSIQVYGFFGKANLKSVEIQDCRQQLYGQKVQK